MGGPEPDPVFRGPHLVGGNSISPDPIAFCVGDVTIAATLDAATPTNTWLRLDILLAIQPAAVYGTFQGVYAGLVDSVRVAGHSNEHVISVCGVIPNTASFETTVV